jgi:ubiquitin carboxyl-terminal hydrolase 4/11/15
LNRVKNPPYIERKDVLNLDNLAVAGVEAWDLHCKRNDSLVMDTFYGQFKSTCICPKCDRISTTWDVFNHISLEIPKNLERTIPILLYRTHSESQSSSFPMLYGISMTEGSTILQLKSVLSELCCIPISNIGLCQINENAITDIFQDSKKIPFASGGMVAGYEIIPFSERTSIHVMVTHYVQGDCDLGIETEKFGRPILISFDESYTCHQVRVHIWNQLSYIISPETDQSLFKVLFKTSHSNGKVKSATIPDSDEVFVSFTKEECNKSILSITVDWSSYNERALLEKSRFVSFNEHPSVDLIRSQRPAMDKHLTLDACFKRFINPEVLDESNKVSACVTKIPS